MKVIYLILIGILLSVGVSEAGTYICSQENANQSNTNDETTNCILNYNGTYWTTQNFNLLNLSTDNLWNTAAYVSPGQEGRIRVNYTLPNETLSNVTWQIKTTKYGTVETYNLSIPTECYIGLKKMHLIFYADMTSTGQNYQLCVNTTNNEMVIPGGSNPSSGLDGRYLYDEKIFWEVNRTYYMNLTFSQNTTVQLSWEKGTKNFTNITNIYENLNNYTIGQLQVEWNNGNQIAQLMNNNNSNINETLIVESGTSDIGVTGYVWAQSGGVPDTTVKIYKAVNTSYQLYQSTTTERGGKYFLWMKAGTYLFVVNQSGYDYYARLKPVLDSTSWIYLYLTQNQTYPQQIIITSNCPQKTATTTTCYVIAGGLYPTTIKYKLYRNNTGYTIIENNASTYGQTSQSVLTVTLSPSTYIWNITIEGDGQNVSTIIAQWENLTNRSVQINIPTGTPARQDQLFIVTIILVVAATIAAISNEYVKGSGLYTYGLILTGFSGFLQLFWVCGAVAGFMLVLAVSKRVIG